MPQNTKRIDVTKSFFVTDPNSVMENLGYTGREDDPLDPPPIIAYEGYNFIPTSYGYRSYFGANSKLDIALLDQTSHHCDKVFIFQLANYANILIALCDDGIWYTESTSVQGADWIQGVTMTAPTSPTIKEWTYCMIKNVLYLYRQGEASYHKIAYTDYTLVTGGVTLTFTSVVPTFLNMAGQIGIFRANSSLGFWDSANSIAWSNPLDLQDFTPSLTTMAGNAIFNGILGRIVVVKSQGDNFIVYTTKGIVGVRYVSSTTMIWEATTITDTAGIRTSKEVTNSITEMEHYAYTNTGIKKIGSYNALSKVHQFEDIIPEIYDLIRESDVSPTPIIRAVPRITPPGGIGDPGDPPTGSGNHIYLDFLNGRYLFICITTNRIIDGLVSATLNTVRTLPTSMLVNGVNWPGLVIPDNVLIVDSTDGTTTLPLALEIKKDADPDYTDDMYLVWRPTGKGTFANQVTPLNDYKQDSTGHHVANVNNKVTATISAITDDAKNLSLASYYQAVTPTFPDHMDDLGYEGYGSIAAGVDHLGVMDNRLLAYAEAQDLEFYNLGLIQTANKAIFDAVSPSPEEIMDMTEQRFRTDDSGIHTEISTAITNFIAGKWEGQAYGTPGEYSRAVTYTVEDLNLISDIDAVKGPGVFSGVGTNYASYLLETTLIKARRIKRYIVIASIRAIIKRQRFITTVGPVGYIGGGGYIPSPITVDIDKQRISNTNNAFQTFIRELNTLLVDSCLYPETTNFMGYKCRNPQLVPITHPTDPTVLQRYEVYRDTYDPETGELLTSGAYFGTVDKIIDPNWIIQGEPDISLVDGSLVTVTALLPSGNIKTGLYYICTYNSYDFWYTIGGNGQYRMSNAEIVDINIPVNMIAYQSNITWTLATEDPAVPGYDFSEPQAGYNMPLSNIPDYNQIDSGWALMPVNFGYTYPGATFLMQDGIPAPYYPTYVGALVLDTALKKWGKMKASFKTLLDYSPFNSASGDVVPYSNLGVDMGILAEDGYIYNMDAKPLDSYMKYGKIGYFRKGYTYLEEVRINFRLPSTGTVKLSGSLSGVTLDKDMDTTHAFTDALNINCYGHIAAKWHTIEISGNYDIQYVEYRGTLSSRR